MPAPAAVILLAPLIQGLLAFIFREVVIKFVLMLVVFIAMVELIPLALDFVAPYIIPGGLNSAFSAIPPGVWFFWDAFALDFGLPMVIGAYIARFSVRRLPIVG